LGVPDDVDTEGWSLWRAVKLCQLYKENEGDWGRAVEGLEMYDDMALGGKL